MYGVKVDSVSLHEKNVGTRGCGRSPARQEGRLDWQGQCGAAA